jgi:flagellar FliL protein
MAEQEAPPPSDPPKKASSPKKLRLVRLLVALFCGVAIALGAYIFKKNIGLWRSHQHHAFETNADSWVFVNIPVLLVNLKSSPEEPHFLKTSLTLSVKNHKNAKYINEIMPRIMDALQTYFRGLTLDDLQGRRGIFLLKQQMRLILNKVSSVPVEDVLFRKLLVQ